ncbi:hypothetical protein JRQ81_015499, partial [Phrynocephalus forsythii]
AETETPYQQPPGLNVQTVVGRCRCQEYHTRVREGLVKSVSRVVNLSKVFGNPQKKAETPDEYLDRIKKGMQQCAGLDPELPENEVALKLQFVSGAYLRYPEEVTENETFSNTTTTNFSEISLESYDKERFGER